MNWTPIVAAALGPLVIYLISRLSNGPEVALRQRLLDDIKIRDSLSEGTPERKVYEETIAADAKRIHNLRDVIDAQRSSTLAIWLLGTASAMFLVAALTSSQGSKVPLFVVAGVYFFGTIAMVGAKSRIKRFKDAIGSLNPRPVWIWRNALSMPFTLKKEKLEFIVKNAEEIII